MVNVFQSLLLVIAGATQKELARQIKYLKVENQILRSKLPKRIMVTPKERFRFEKLFSQFCGLSFRSLLCILARGFMPEGNRLSQIALRKHPR
ncbi:hypothetical protein ETAA8_36370 [Anatilimnocola aggregata]|uniref:Uncharacterized protein n=1 Tax=Anatilimnocola aggregata TaxID=2528021 RepID=A0A517YE75_9BACT|nr:hypothetical protein ETAA8_36370 [Anatilimnocola aggregata]